MLVLSLTDLANLAPDHLLHSPTCGTCRAAFFSDTQGAVVHHCFNQFDDGCLSQLVEISWVWL